MNDTVDHNDSLAADLAPPAAPLHPCPRCGAETKEHTEGRRICSRESCRVVLKG